ncbi:hypothetical protein BpHYR1_001716 [Brachionus plicatilis]|uniref:Uncharacterized protein n=1 Tax=Brachionus plicatilis TaxID=10195 RepID=A0A3M7T0E9_BRAPC|nr:hypothetical protein BpHYR1_001716 [Brachionus plicatilis]
MSKKKLRSIALAFFSKKKKIISEKFIYRSTEPGLPSFLKTTFPRFVFIISSNHVLNLPITHP